MTDVRHKGGCHCGAVAFTVEAPSVIDALSCSCSICSMTGFNHLIVSKNQFQLIKGADDLVSYRFNTGTADHLFCGICGVKSFYHPRSHPDGISVNINCLDMSSVEGVSQGSFDGANWEANIDSIR